MMIQALALSIANQLVPGEGAGDYRISKDGTLYMRVTVDGIEFMAELPTNNDNLETSGGRGTPDTITEDALRQRLPRVAQAMTKANAWIPEPEFRIRTVFCTERMNEFVLVNAEEKPGLLLTRLFSRVNPDVATHETGHAVLWPHEKRHPQGKLIRALYCIWRRLGDTQYVPVTIDGDPYRSPITGLTERDKPIGYLLFDPSRWSPESYRIEHPWKDFSEVFTSAFEAYNVAPMALMSSLDRAKQIDTGVYPHADDLIAILEAMNPERGSDPAALNAVLDTVLGRSEGCPDQAPTLDAPTPLRGNGDVNPNVYDYLQKPSLLLRDKGKRLN